MLRNSITCITILVLALALSSSLYSQTPSYMVAILDLSANGVSEAETRSLSNELRTYITELLNSKEYQSNAADRYTVLERSQMDKILDQFNIQNLGCTDIACAVEFGKMFNVERIIIGSVGLVGQTYTMSLSIVDIESSVTLKGASYRTAGTRDDLLNEGIPEVSRALFGLGRGFPYLRTAIITTAVTTVSAIVYYLITRTNEGEITIDIPVPQE